MENHQRSQGVAREEVEQPSIKPPIGGLYRCYPERRKAKGVVIVHMKKVLRRILWYVAVLNMEGVPLKEMVDRPETI